jgi:ribonucleoside-diphosphate reductase alpha subunit
MFQNNFPSSHTTYVTKRNGDKEEVSFDKVIRRIKFLSTGLNVNPIDISQHIISQIKPNILTSELDLLGADICINMSSVHPDYGKLASRILISNHHKNTSPSFSECVEILYRNKDKRGESAPLINDEVYSLVMENKNKINDVINHERDNKLDYFGFKTLERSYLLKSNGKIIERPQYMWMRTALGIHRDDFKDAIETYDLMSQGYFTHATPTLFNAGTRKEQLSSCFLLTMKDDSIEGIYDTLKQCALISQNAGGIGLSVHNIRSLGSYIRGTGGASNGLVPMLKVYNNTAKYVDQGGQKRCGSFAIYLEPHHPDIMYFLDMKKNTGSEDLKARDLFYAVWLSDEFMRRVDNDEKWTLLDPDEFPGLHDVYGDEYSKLYRQYERDFNMRYKYEPNELKSKVIKARDVWHKIIESQVETGTPYIGYKDAVNSKNNQANLGTIRSSNLCIEINLFTSKDEVAVCNLASICLPMFVNKEKRTFDFAKLRDVVKVVVKNLNKVIDINYYPVPEARNSNLKHRPIGCGVQGLADTFCLMKMPFDSKEAKELNRQIAEHMYLAGVEASMEISKKRSLLVDEFIQLVNDTYDDWKHLTYNKATKYIYNIPSIEFVLNHDEILFKYKQTINEWQTAQQLAATIGADNSGLNDFDDIKDILSKMKRLLNLHKILKLIPEELDRDKYYGAYSSFIGSPLHKGQLQYDMWNDKPCDELLPYFNKVKEEIQKYGLRNSTLFAYMPTASTSQIQGNNECFEPYTYNIYTRKVLSGQHRVINKHLLNDLMEIGLWNSHMKDLIIAHSGSVQNIDEIPSNIKEIYKTVWEIKQKVLIDYAADRAPFICQTQSMNLFISEPTLAKMTSMHFYAWQKGLKTGIYYLRTRTKANAQQFTVDPSLLQSVKKKEIKHENNNKNDEETELVVVQKMNIDIEGFVCSKDNPDCEACGA